MPSASFYRGLSVILVSLRPRAYRARAVQGLIQIGQINDFKRVKFIQDYLKQVLRAKREGINVGGYFIWSFMDNFEWAEGLSQRFGLVYVDYKSLKRTVKKSGEWYGKVAAGNALPASTTG
jgi:beta-glucosidase